MSGAELFGHEVSGRLYNQDDGPTLKEYEFVYGEDFVYIWSENATNARDTFEWRKEKGYL